MKRWIYGACLATVFAVSAATMSAAPLVSDMGDHPDGALSARGAYGLRTDNVALPPMTGGDVRSTLFSVELGGAAVSLSFDPDDLGAGAVLQGTLYNTYLSGYGTLPGLATLYYELDDLSATSNDGFDAQEGEGYIQYGSFILSFSGKSDGDSVFTFDNDGHRLPATDAWVARGWLQNFVLCNQSEEVTLTWSSQEPHVCEEFSNYGTNDFLLTGTTPGGDLPEVPEPSTMLLTMGGVALLWFRKRRS